MNQPTTPDLSGYGAQVIEENGRFALTYWPYCAKCKSPFQFDAEEPFAYCSCGATEWGDPRPASWVSPAEVQKLRKALIECKRQAASMRIWNGMGWTYHPPQAKKIFDAAEAALSTLKTESKP